MTVLSANIQRPVKLMHGELKTKLVPLAGYTNFGAGSTAHTVYKGSILVIDVSDTDGYARAMPDSASVNMAAGDIFAGIAAEKQVVDSSVPGDGDKEVSAYRDGVWGFPKGSIAQTDVGAPAYASDDNTVTTTSTVNLWIGYIEGVDDTYVWVNIEPAFMRANAAT